MKRTNIESNIANDTTRSNIDNINSSSNNYSNSNLADATDSTTNIITLSEEQLEYAKQEWSKEYQFKGEDGCLCGYYECFINGVGNISIDLSCRKSSICPDGMSWIVHDNIQVWNTSLATYGYVPMPEETKEDDLGIVYLGLLNTEQTKILREVIRMSVIRDYSYDGETDEYGNNINGEEGDLSDDNNIESINTNELNTATHAIMNMLQSNYDFSKILQSESEEELLKRRIWNTLSMYLN